MKLIECYIESFGKIKDKRITFTDGLNCIKDDNGSGKTTLSVFIKVMLYGMSDTKKASLEENDRKHYLPWDGSAARGSLTFEADGKQYRIERFFAPKPADDTFALYDCSTGKPSSDYSERVGEELFGIDADGFERTVFLSERALTPKSENKSVSAKLSDLVGCDGDIGVMDDAMKLLEDRRKFYYKKGGSGELSDIKARVVEAAKSLERLSEVEADAEKAEKHSEELRLEAERLSKEKARLLKERESSALSVARADFKRRQEELKSELSALNERKAALLDFFGETPPTFSEITENALKLNEAEGIEQKAKCDIESPEYKELKKLFHGKINEAEAESIRHAIYEEKARREVINCDEAIKLNRKFSKRIPAHKEVDELIVLAADPKKDSKKNIRISFLVGGIIFTLLGLCLGLLLHFAFLFITILGIAGIVLAFSGKAPRDDSRGKFDVFYMSISDEGAPEDALLLSDLYDVKTSIDKAVSLRDTASNREADAILSSFCERFSSGYTADNIVCAEELLKKYERFITLRSAVEYRLEEQEKALKKAEELRSSALDFARKYRTASSKPFDEIREKLNEYERVTDSVTEKTHEAENFAKQYGTESESEDSSRPTDEINRDLTAVEERITAAERERAVTERAYEQLCEELETKDELAIKLSELEELYEKQNANYNVVIKTKEYLERAKDEMTSKYLGKTKAGFERYSALIGGESEDRFEMTTDFGISKFEGASTKSADAYSRGTKDLYNLAARLSLIDSLYDEEKPFIILDDPFIAFDDGKTEAALKLLSKLGEEKQIIYFTCSKARTA